MRKVLLVALMFAFSGSLMAQLSRYARKYEQRVPRDAAGLTISGPVNPVNLSVNSKAVLDDQLGTTLYDLQTYASAQNRFYVYPDGTMAGCWMMGNNSPDFGDRGTGYNYFDGNSWGPPPAARIESIKTGWPSYCPWNGNGELVVAHNGSASLVMNTRPQKGSGSWTQKLAPVAPPGVTGLICPRAITGGTTHQNIHILCLTTPMSSGGQLYQGLDGALLYWRSTNGGISWDKNGIMLPGLSSADYDGFSGDEYAWGTPHGDTIYFAAGGPYCDTFIMKSTDNGNTWTKIPVLSNQYKKVIAAVSNIPPWYSVDGSLACEMGPGGVIHLAAGIGGGYIQSGLKYIMANRNGLIYWNTTMPMLKDSLNLDTLDSRGQLLGYYADGPGAGDTLRSVPYYRVGLTSHPQLSFDTYGNLLAVWDGITYMNPEPVSGVNYRHIWLRALHHGSSYWWGFDQTDLTSYPEYNGLEFVFPAMAKTSLHGTVDFIYQSDNVPGSIIYNPGPLLQTSSIGHMKIPYLWVGVPVVEKATATIGQNFPNPCSGNTSFNLCLGSSSEVIVNITDFSGQVILSDDKGFLLSGSHRITLKTGNLNPGIYFYSAKINGHWLSRKMIVE